MVTRLDFAQKLGRCKKGWCGRGDLNPHGPYGPTDFRTLYGFRRPSVHHGTRSLGSGLSLHHAPDRMPKFRRCPSSLYTFQAGELNAVQPGLARDRHFTGFPEFEQFCIAGFPGEHSSFASSPVRLPFRHARTSILSYSRSRRRGAREEARKSATRSCCRRFRSYSACCGGY